MTKIKDITKVINSQEFNFYMKGWRQMIFLNLTFTSNGTAIQKYSPHIHKFRITYFTHFSTSKFLSKLTY